MAKRNITNKQNTTTNKPMEKPVVNNVAVNKKEVLILGNGISLLLHDAFIKNYKGEIWGCNLIYLKYGSLLTRITGHSEAMVLAKKERKNKQYKYEIWGGHLGLAKTYEKIFSVDKKYFTNSGTTLVAQALKEGYAVKLCGFDFGGKDVYTENHDKHDKSIWINRMREVISDFNAKDKISFVGYDHKPFLISNLNANQYYINYVQGKSHIADAEYLKLLKTYKHNKLPVKLTDGYITIMNMSSKNYMVNKTEMLKPTQTAKVSETFARTLLLGYPGDFKLIEE